MEIITITDEKRIGTLNADGSYLSWPELDIYGKPYEHANGTTRRLSGAQQFVVIPPKKDRDDLDIVYAGAAIAPPVPAAQPPKPGEPVPLSPGDTGATIRAVATPSDSGAAPTEPTPDIPPAAETDGEVKGARRSANRS